MKKKVLMLLMPFFLAAISVMNASPTQTGVLYEYVVDPSDQSGQSERASVLQWFVNNFDAHNIPLTSSMKLYNSTTKRILGIDSVYRDNPLIIKNRSIYWAQAMQGAITYAILFPWYVEAPLYTANATGKVEGLNIAKAIVDSANKKGLLPPTPITVTSEIKEGYYNTDVSIEFPQYESPDVAGEIVFLRAALVEGYHNYNNKEESYFIPRDFYNMSNGMEILWKNAGTYNLKLSAPVDKKWNSKLLYTVIWLERGNGAILDAAVDKVPNLKQVTTLKPIKLDITVAANDDFKTIDAGKTTTLNFTVMNPTTSNVTAEVYIDKTTSDIPDDWKVTLNKQVINNLPPSQSSTVTVTVEASTVPEICGIDLCVRPYGVADNENAITSNKLTVLSEKNISTLVFSEKASSERTLFIFGVNNTAYAENTGLISPIFHSVIPADKFSGFMYNCMTPLVQENIISVDRQTLILNYGTYNNNWDQQDNNLMSTYLTTSELNFLSSVISNNKHLALFMDKSAWYATSELATADEKAKYNSLFTAYGVSLASDSTFYVTNPSTTDTFYVHTVPTDSLGRDSQGSALDLRMSRALYNNNWNITNAVKATKIGYYDDNTASNAIIKSRNGNQKLVLFGCGFGGLNAVSSIQQSGAFIDNIYTWWYGYKPKLIPTLKVDSNTVDFGSVHIDESKRYTIKVKNDGESDQGPLKIFSVEWIFEPTDDAMKIIHVPTQIAPGGVDSIVVEFSPKNEVIYEENLMIISNDTENSPYNMHYSGVGVPKDETKIPKIVVSPANLKYNFGKHDAGTGPYESDAINIYNEGEVDLQIASIKVIGDSPSGIFALKNADFAVVKPDDYAGKDFFVLFNPTGNATYKAQVEISTNDPQTPVILFDVEGISGGSGIVSPAYANFTVSPNPATDEAKVNFTIPEKAASNKVKIAIIDYTGKVISNVMDSHLGSGIHTHAINTSNLISGNYYIELYINENKMVIPLKIVK